MRSAPVNRPVLQTQESALKPRLRNQDTQRDRAKHHERGSFDKDLAAVQKVRVAVAQIGIGQDAVPLEGMLMRHER